MKAFAAISALVMIAGPAGAQDLPGTTMLKASDPAGVARYLNQLGYRAKLTKDKQGDPKIETGLGGFNAGLYFYGCEKGADCTSFQFQVGIASDTKLSLEQVNNFNKQYRFSQLSLDEERDPWLYYDLPSGTAGISGDAFAQAVDIYEEQLNKLDRLLDETKAAAK